MVLAYTKEQGPESDPYLVPIYAAPVFLSEPIDPIPSGSTSSSSASQPSSIPLSMPPRSWMIGALPPISLAIGSTTMSWPISTHVSSSSKLKQTQYVLPSCSAKDDLKRPGHPSSWRTWSALHRSLCTVRGAVMGLKLPSVGVGSIKHEVVLS